ncbi:MAG: hypothetical protein KC589_02630, partial [Nanoarchaeota archaeon]|nr:hypothetical protein [Nanoarchaeota archaeon]
KKIIKMKKIKIMIMTLFAFLFMQTSFAFTTELIKTDPSPIVAGDYADITLRFTNPSGVDTEKTNLIFEIVETSFIKSIGEKEKLNKMLSGETVTRTFRVFFSKDLKQGEIDLPIIVRYGETQIKKDIRVFIEEADRMPEILIGQIETSPSELLQDSDNNKLKIKIQNLGDKSAELLSAQLVSESDDILPSYSYSFQDSISSIEGGEEQELEFTMDIKENVQEEIPAKLNLRYRAQKSVGSSYDIFEKTIDLKIPITPAPYLVIEKVEQIGDFSLGSVENKLKITIKNEGQKDAEEVRIRAVPDISYPFIFEETTQYVSAKIKAGESRDVIFITEVSEDGDLREYDSIAIIETLIEDSRYSREDSFSITTSPGNKKDNSFYGYLIMIAIIIVSIIIGLNTYFSRKKTKNK